jgi:hypothetical protein
VLAKLQEIPLFCPEWKMRGVNMGGIVRYIRGGGYPEQKRVFPYGVRPFPVRSRLLLAVSLCYLSERETLIKIREMLRLVSVSFDLETKLRFAETEHKKK